VLDDEADDQRRNQEDEIEAEAAHGRKSYLSRGRQRLRRSLLVFLK
jgi:hypothetical protein